MPTFTATQTLPYPIALVFAFFANPENLPRLMPRWQRARIEEATFAPAPPRPADAPRYPGTVAGPGTRLTISFRPFPFAPFRLPWEALIEDFSWNHGFCDTQTRGPFTYWRHCHTLTALTPTTTLLRDEVHYELPLAPLARPALTYTFHHRQKRTLELLARATKTPT